MTRSKSALRFKAKVRHAYGLCIRQDLMEYLEYASDVAQEELEASIKKSSGPLRPIEVWVDRDNKDELVVIDGHRRLRACLALEIPKDRIPLRELTFDAAHEIYQYIERNQLANRNLSDFAYATLLRRRSEEMEKSGRKKVIATIAKEVGKSPRTIAREVRLSRECDSMTDRWKSALRTKTVDIPKRYLSKIAAESEEEQEKMLDKILSFSYAPQVKDYLSDKYSALTKKHATAMKKIDVAACARPKPKHV